MKLRISVQRKTGAPNYGSDGVGAELEIELADELARDANAVLQHGAYWYGSLERMVDDQLRRMAGQHNGAGAPPAAIPAPAPVSGGAPSPATTPPAPARNEPGADDDAPQNGRQLLAWAGDRGLKPRVYALKDAWGLPDRIVEWGADDALAVYRELAREAPQRPTSRAPGRNGYARPRA